MVWSASDVAAMVGVATAAAARAAQKSGATAGAGARDRNIMTCAPASLHSSWNCRPARPRFTSVCRSFERSVVAGEPDQAGNARHELVRLHGLRHVHLETRQQE